MIHTIQTANTALLGAGELESVGSFFSPHYVAHFTENDLSGGHDAVRRVVGQLRRSFPDLEVDVEILVQGSDRVAWQRTMRGTQQGAYKGFPASGRRIVWRDMVTSRFENGLIVEEWVLTDLAERLLLARKR